EQLTLLQAREEGHLGEHLALESEAAGANVVLRAALAEPDEDGGDVVLAAFAVRERDELFRSLVAVLLAEVRLELWRGPRCAVETVRGEEELVARQHLDGQGVDLDPLVNADGARYRILLRDLLDLLAGELAALDELVVDGVVLRHLLDAFFAKQIDAAVADVG